MADTRRVSRQPAREVGPGVYGLRPPMISSLETVSVYGANKLTAG